MATLDQLNWERNNPGIPFNPTGPVGNRGMTPEQIASERFKESGGKSSLPGNSGTAAEYPAAGTDAGYEYSADKKQRRKRFHDGKGGFTYGPYEPNPDYKDDADNKANRNAFALLKQVFTQYGLSELADTLEKLMKEGYEPEEAALALKTDVRYNAPYIKRFKGNETRRAAGLNVLSEAEYLTLEDDYTKTLKSYGLESYFGTTKDNKQAAMADIIGKDISSVEFADRVDTSVSRVKMADQATKMHSKNSMELVKQTLLSIS
jgi:hypothetical protein